MRAKPPASPITTLGSSSVAHAPHAESAVASRLAAIIDVARRLSTSHDRGEILQTVVDETIGFLAADVVTLRILEGDELRSVAWAGIDEARAARLPRLSSLDSGYLEILLAGEPWSCEDVRDLPNNEWLERYEGVIDIRGDLLVPLTSDGAVIGALSATTHAPRRWTSDELAVVAALGTHAALAIHNAALFDRMAAGAAQLAVVQAASARMNRARTVEAVGRTIVEELEIIDYHNARVYLLEPPDDLVPIAFSGRVAEYEIVDMELLRTKLGVGFTGWVGLHGQPLRIDDANADPRGAQIPGTPEVDESMLVVPMRYDDEVIGVITLSKLGLRCFDADDEKLLLILADQAAVAIETARLLGRTETLAAELRRLLDLSSELSQSLDPRAVGQVIARHIRSALGVDECVVSMLDRDADRVVTMGVDPPTAPNVDESYRLSEFPETVRVVDTRVTVIVDADDPAADAAEVRVLRDEGFRGMAMFPLVAKGVSVGLVEALSHGEMALQPSQLDLGRTMANEAAMALENARLYEAARSLADRDPLTGLYNHRLLHERLGEELLRAGRAHQSVSVMLLDIDDFKLVNDTFGHQVGDQFLVRLAAVVRSTLRGSDIPARYGGEEFAVILPDADPAAAEAAAGRIHEALRHEPFQPEGRGTVSLSVSIGCATFPVDGRSAAKLIERADARMYEAKAVYHGATDREAEPAAV